MHLQGIHTYDILRNPSYAQQFQYFAANLEDREDYIVDDDDKPQNDVVQSDYVRVMLTLAFQSEEMIRETTFTQEGIQALAERSNIN
mmetsp:Transcript_8384/g.14016  ORF Transcript_8384/g.14016 Transcript_8384/m.14016 type:complete len:87 (+) Transcript_8384:3187-3447(+)